MLDPSGSSTDERDGSNNASRLGNDAGRSLANSGVAFGPRGSSLAPSVKPPGGFNTELRSIMASRNGTPNPDLSVLNASFLDQRSLSEQRLAEYRERLSRETKIKIGSENLLDALNSKNAKQTRDQRLRVESELNSSNRKIAQLKLQLEEETHRAKTPSTPPRGRISNLFRGNVLGSPQQNQLAISSVHEQEAETESSSFVLAEILQALEVENMPSDYYVERANSLVELFKRHTTLKYDLAWSVFGLRIQTMLLSDSREVVAAGYRVVRYAITDRKSLQTIRGLQTDYLVILSLMKDSKASVEREQALKFVRAFLDVKGGEREISKAVVRTIVSVAEHSDDRLKSISVLTLAEILIRDPNLVVGAGGIAPLTEALADANYVASESLVSVFLHLLDMPCTRRLLRPGCELEVVFSSFTDSLSTHGHDQKLRANAKVIAAMLKTWPGLFTLSMYNFRAIRSLLTSVYLPSPSTRDLVFELLFDVLCIKPPSWSSSFLAGRRLTTYGRVAHLKTESHVSNPASIAAESSGRKDLVEHFTALLLAVLLEAGLPKALLYVIRNEDDPALKRKATLLLGEVLKLASHLLPSTLSSALQVLPELFSSAARFGIEERYLATSAIYQVDSVNRTLYRSNLDTSLPATTRKSGDENLRISSESDPAKPNPSVQIDEAHFRSLLVESQVLNSINYTKWKWDIIQEIIEGPLLNPKRLDEAIRASKFVKRLIAFYRPFKYRFSEIRNTNPNQRYVRAGCALMHTLLQNPEGVKYLVENKLLRQIAECLAQLDRMSGLTAPSPLFSESRLSETLTAGYFAMLGVLSSDPRGLQMIERWRMINMFYHIIELKDRDELIKTLLNNMDLTLHSHLRVIVSKALTSGSKNIRIFATKLLRKYATDLAQPSNPSSQVVETTEWAIRLLVTQLYDPEVEVCEVAVKILEKACNRKHSLEYVVRCRPALDHLGEIGAPLLLRFLSTSVGYHYLDGLDYINQEMDDWFLGRNDTYVALVEASLARAFSESTERPGSSTDDPSDRQDYGIVPAHFYRELTRTAEGCRLLRGKGHFEDFVYTIREYGMESSDSEIVLKVKGCMWAVGNVGSMELGASFLEDYDVVKYIVNIADQSEVLTLRGTAFFVLGLISRSLHGLEILTEYGWDSPTSPSGESLGFCVPLNLPKLLSIKPWLYASGESHETVDSKKPTASSMIDEDPVNAKILELVADLGNTVLTKRAAGELHHIKARKPGGFQEPRLFHRIMAILACHHFHLPVRRFIINLFDKSVIRIIVLDEVEDEDAKVHGPLES